MLVELTVIVYKLARVANCGSQNIVNPRIILQCRSLFFLANRNDAFGAQI